jgi:hypothetical protein
VLRYEAVLEPGTGRKLINIDQERRFVVSFFMAGKPLFMAAVLVAMLVLYRLLPVPLLGSGARSHLAPEAGETQQLSQCSRKCLLCCRPDDCCV